MGPKAKRTGLYQQEFSHARTLHESQPWPGSPNLGAAASRNSMLMVPADEHDSVTMSHTCDNY